jgi:hypothetical protein
MITVTSWRNAAVDAQGRPTGMRDGYQPGDPVVRVFTYQADPAGRTPEQIAEEAFAIGNGHPGDARGEDLARRYYERQLRSGSFPGNSSCCGRSCCAPWSVVWRQRRRASARSYHVNPQLHECDPGEKQRVICSGSPGRIGSD